MFKNQSQSKQNFQLQSSKQMIQPYKVDGIDIVFENIRYSVKVQDKSVKSSIPCKRATKQKEILKDISGILKAGQTTAIMGASGAGKTTLLNILACRIKPQEGGKLFANNLEYNHKSFGDFANYVMQTDVLIQTMTVRQTLDFAAKLRLNLPQEERKQRVNLIANEMKLEKCLDTFVGGVVIKGVSGGEKRRTSIAFELISDPQVIFLDEPTSGLDSLTSYIICSVLKKLANNQNKTVVMTIHQPNSEIYKLFDELLLLLDGRLIYHNKAYQVKQYFEKRFDIICPQYTNVSEFFMSKIHHQNQSNVKRYPQYFEAYQKYQKPSIDDSITQKLTNQVTFRKVNVGFFTAFNILVQRSLLDAARNRALLRMKIINFIFMAIMIGGLYFDIGTQDYTKQTYWRSITGCLFFLTIGTMMRTLLPISLVFPLERDVFFKEQASKMYNVVEYFLSRNIVQIPQLTLVPILFACINYFMIDLSNTAEQFFFHCLVYGLISFSGTSLGLLIGSLIMDPKSVATFMPIVVFPLFLFSGFFKNRADLPVWIGWIQYVSPNKYGFIAFLQNEVQFRDSNIQQLNFDVTKWEAVILLFCLGIFYRLLSFIFLWAAKKRNK